MRTLGRYAIVMIAMLAPATFASQATKTTTTTATASTRPATPTSDSTTPDSTPSDAVAEESDWSQRLNRLALLLAGSDLTALQRTLEPSPTIRAFASDSLQTPERLLGTTTGSKILGVHAYEKVPATLASDLAGDFSSAGDVVPQNVRDGMQPRDDVAAKKANETASQWLAQVLRPQKDEVTGVIILWPQPRGRSLSSAPARAIFVLVKAHKSPADDGAYTFRQITFGDPLETPQ